MAAGGWNPAVIIEALLLNGAWGLGVALLRSGVAASPDDAIGKRRRRLVEPLRARSAKPKM